MLLEVIVLGHFTDQIEYWDEIGSTKTFSHPVNFSWLDGSLDSQSRILDYGCGYGRVMNLLYEHGYRNIEGVDFSTQMIHRSRQSFPHLSFQVIQSPLLSYTDGSFDAVLLFAVLTCIPHDEDQRVLIDELVRVLKPGGILYISDLGLQSDKRNRDRYDLFQQKYGVYGVFETGDGAVCRHHTMEWLRTLASSCELLATEEVEVVTMNGHHSQAVQVLARKSPVEGR
jgi:ubiquinone/menaquinone biosynthesis C-methylase UbiE